MAECRRYVGGSRTKGGYVRLRRGVRRADGRREYVMLHRHIVERVEGRKLKPWPEEIVLHSCDTPDCFLYEHLTVGSVADNNRDKVEKGRAVYPRGDDHGHSKLTEDDVRAIRSRRGDGATYEALMADFDVCKSTIGMIVNRQTWKHIE